MEATNDALKLVAKSIHELEELKVSIMSGGYDEEYEYRNIDKILGFLKEALDKLAI